MLIGSLVELHVGLHSCLCFPHLEKLVLKVGLTPPRYLLDNLLSVELLHFFLIAFPTTSRYLVDRSRKLLPPRQLLDTQWIDRVSVLSSDELFLDTSSIPQLSTTISLIPSSIAVSIPLNTCIYRALLRIYIFVLCDLILISSISLDLSAPVHLPNTISLTPNLFLYDFSSFFKIFFSW